MGRCRIPNFLLTILVYVIFSISLDFPGPGSCDSLTPINRSWNILSTTNWFGFVIKSPVMSPVGHHSTEISHFPIRSVTKWYRMFMCFAYFLLEALYLLSKIVSLLLFWKTISQRHHILDLSTIIWYITRQEYNHPLPQPQFLWIFVCSDYVFSDWLWEILFTLIDHH